MGNMEHLKLTFLIPLAGVISGIIAAASFPSLALAITAFCIALSLITWLTISILSRNPIISFRMAKWHAAWIFLIFCSLGSINLFFNQPNHNLSESETYHISGIIMERKILAQGDRFFVKVNKISDETGKALTPHNFNILLKTDGLNASVGDMIVFSSKLKLIPSTIKSSNRYSEFLNNHGIRAETFVNFNKIKKFTENNSISSRLIRFREHLEILIEKSSLNRDTGDFLISVLLGDKSFLEPSVKNSLNSAGLSHILALSGMHVAIIIALLSFLLFPLTFIRYQKIRIWAIILLVWTYIAITGFAYSAVRAGIMAILLFGSLLLERKNSALNGLLFATLIILLISPYALWDIGLQLSFLCVASIIIFTPALNPVDHHHHPKLYKFFNLILLSLITSIATWALIAYYFKNIPLLFLPANLLLVPFLPVFVGGGIFFVVLLTLGIDTGIIASFLNYFYENFLNLSSFLSFNGSGVVTLKVNATIVLLWTLTLISIAISLYVSRRKIRYSLFSLSFISAFFSLTLLFLSKEPYVRSLQIPHSFTSLEARVYNPDGQDSFKFKRQSFSKLLLGNNEIYAVDCPLNPEAYSLMNQNETDGKRFLLLGADADFGQLIEYGICENFHHIIFHASVGKNKKQELLDKIPDSLRSRFYSIRENGSFEIEL